MHIWITHFEPFKLVSRIHKCPWEAAAVALLTVFVRFHSRWAFLACMKTRDLKLYISPIV